MKNIPKIKLSDITPSKLKGIRDGYKVFDLDTNKYYEKVNGVFQEMVEESKEDSLLPEGDIETTKHMIDSMVASGDTIQAANLLMNIRTTKNHLKTQKDAVNQRVNFMFDGTADQIDIVQARVSEVTEEAIKNASFDELRQFFVFDGKEVKLNYDEMLSNKDKEEAYREFLLYLKSIADADTEIDKEMNKLDELIDHFDPEMVTKSNDVYEWDDYVYELFLNKLSDPNIDEKERVRISRIVELRESAYNLRPIIDSLKDELSKGRRSSLLNAFNTRFNDTIAKAEKYAASHGLKIYFKMFDNIEEKIGITEWRNIFIYLFARYIKYNADHLSKIDAAFIAQVTQNLIMLKKDQLKEPGRSKFAAGVKEIISILSET